MHLTTWEARARPLCGIAPLRSPCPYGKDIDGGAPACADTLRVVEGRGVEFAEAFTGDAIPFPFGGCRGTDGS